MPDCGPESEPVLLGESAQAVVPVIVVAALIEGVVGVPEILNILNILFNPSYVSKRKILFMYGL